MDPIKIIEYRGFDIEIHQDLYPMNPFTDCDGEYPLMYTNRDGVTDFSDGNIDTYLNNYLTDGQVTRHQAKILDLIGVERDCFNMDYPIGDWTKEERADILRQQLSDWISESIDHRVYFCEAFEIKHYYGTSKGHYQGDCADVFICWTPEFERVTGRNYETVTAEDMECSFAMFGHWAWGEVYGFNIAGLDSCWGFYGDIVGSGLLVEAKHQIDYHLEAGRKKHIERAKELIRNRVPLAKRAGILG